MRAKIGNATPESHVSYSDTQRSNRSKISRGNDGNESGTRTETASSNEKRDAAFLPNVVYIGLTQLAIAAERLDSPGSALRKGKFLASSENAQLTIRLPARTYGCSCFPREIVGLGAAAPFPSIASGYYLLGPRKIITCRRLSYESPRNR